jgi:formylglycine-generating enzyme required for sulfatase activity
LLKDGDCSEKKLRASLERLAFQAHQAAAATHTGDWKPADITEDMLKLQFARLDAKGQRLDWAGKVVEAIRHRAGLLQSEDGKTFQFTYRFQEFLAGGYLADKDAWERDHQREEARGQMPSFAKRAAALFDPAGYWRNVITWAAGIRAHVKGDLGDVRDLVHEFCQVSAPPDAPARRQLVFAADLVREVRFRDLLELSWGKETVEDLRLRLQALVQSSAPVKEFPLKERAEVASQLGWMHDPREGVGTVPRSGHKDRPDLLWTAVIQPDDFVMGGKVPGCQDVAEFPHRLGHPFCVAAFPITVAQFELFIQDGGYAREELWTKAGWQWRERKQRTRPDDYESPFQTPNHPRVGVTWYEAVAFCNWVNATFTPEELKLPERWKVRLPSEAEWERAARHTDGRDFPWDPRGNAEPANRCNCAEAGLRQTSAVGLFPSGKAECGAHDMAGNVWEWTRSLWGRDWQNASFNYPYKPDDGRENLRTLHLPDFSRIPI